MLGFENGRIQTQTLYEFREEGMRGGKIQGTLVKSAELVHRDKLLAAGYTAEGIHGCNYKGYCTGFALSIFVL